MFLALATRAWALSPNESVAQGRIFAAFMTRRAERGTLFSPGDEL